ncbi:lipocalin-like domain-containing protein [Sphingobacterium daejeonense]|uniref:lipocalin-like domain-containing protein n=1 Tax=Sphingobacterium daejeonense TaxID=371142 RepID=UPI0010C44FE9|nr:lipocalin-like domain-containing protein [Sphingobacterium daejeonense]VTP91823.1 Uncharacterised protein [Sphingobacterium daejeonense]
MKRFIFLISIIITLCSCERNEIEINNNSIIGEWKLVQIDQYVMNPSGAKLSTTDYSSKNVIYNFQKNNLLKVSGGENFGYSNGEYPYEFKKDYLSGFPSPEETKINLVIINDSKWVF